VKVGGRFSEAMEAELRALVVQHGVVCLLDSDGRYTGLVDRLMAQERAGRLPYAVRAFRGSYLELMLACEGLEDGVDKAPLLIHLPGLNKESVRATPALELYRMGHCHERALATLVEEACAELVGQQERARLVGELTTLEAADEALDELLAGEQDGVGARLRALRPAALLAGLMEGGLGELLGGALGDEDLLVARVCAAFGVPPEWREAMLPLERPVVEDLIFLIASWAMGVEYVHDLRRAPLSAQLAQAKQLPKVTVEACKAAAAMLRVKAPGRYRRIADEVEAWLIEEVEGAAAEDLGKIDTFRFEEDRVLKAALDALAADRWASAEEWARDRLDGGSFWVHEEPLRHSAWTLIALAARLGLAVQAASGGVPLKLGVEGAVERYTKQGAPVDRLHRELEQQRLALLDHGLPEYEVLRARLDRMREVWRVWADVWARDFNNICRAYGFLPAAPLMQRGLFDEVVRPLTRESGATAYFVVDAMRYEMAEALRAALDETPATTIELSARLSELPSVTEIGMNALAPVSVLGKMTPSMTAGGPSGFSTGEFKVYNPETRKRAMHERVGGNTCPWLPLEEVINREVKSLKQTIAQARLVVVHSVEIDSAGENGNGPAVFELVLRNLRTAWKLLRDAGVRRFVFTADHGFLLLDDRVAAAQPHGRKADPKRRHVYSEVGADHAGEVRVSLAELGYEGAPGFLMFPETTAVFDTGRRSMSFVHGGNSLQERVIPVLTVQHRAQAGGSVMRYRVEGEVREGVGGMHCMELHVEAQAQQGLDFGGSREVELALRAAGEPGVLVELCQARGKARIVGGALVAQVGERVELFFRLSGPQELRVLVEVYHPSAQVELAPCIPNARFAVSALRAPAAAQQAEAAGLDAESEVTQLDEPSEARSLRWLEALPEEGGVRAVFEHLASHGAVTEQEVIKLTGSPRRARSFATKVDTYSALAPFGVRVESVGASSAKRYVREGGA
jgi:hypothetical protein